MSKARSRVRISCAGREVAEGDGDASCRAVGEEGHDPNEAEAEKNEDGDQGALRLLDARRRHENGEEAGILPLRAEHPEDAVVVPAVRRDVLDEDVARLRVDLQRRRKRRVRREVDRRCAHLAVPDEGEVGLGPDLDALEEIRAQDVSNLHHPDRVGVRVPNDVDRFDDQTLRLVKQHPLRLRLRLGIGDQLRLQCVARLLLGKRDDPSFVIGDVHVADDEPRLQGKQEVGKGITVPSLSELARRRKAGNELRGVRRAVRLVLDLVQRHLGQDLRLVGELVQDEVVRLVDRDSDHNDKCEDAHQHVSADERPQEARREELIHSPS